MFDHICQATNQFIQLPLYTRPFCEVNGIHEYRQYYNFRVNYCISDTGIKIYRIHMDMVNYNHKLLTLLTLQI